MKLPSLNTQILLGALFGVLLGLLLGSLEAGSSVREAGFYASTIAGGVFVGLLKMVLVPLLFTSIVVGVANLQEHKQMHKVWVSTLVFFSISMAIAVLLGLVATNIFSPGAGMHLGMFADAMKEFQTEKLTVGEFFSHFILGLFQNPFTSLAQSNVLAVVIFALFVGIALVIGGSRYRNFLVLIQEAFDLVMMIVGWIMRLAPFGIMALLTKLVATQDVTLFASMGKFMAVVIGITLVHGVIVLPSMLYMITRVTPWQFWKGAREALVTAFATSSSSATLPVTLRCTEQHLHVRREIAGFVVPLGATINMDGTALYEASAALFIANLVGVELNLAQQLIVFFMAMIASVGAPGIPSAGMVTMVMVLQSVGLPAEAIAILLPIDRLLDTLRTTVNVEGDMIGSLIVQEIVKTSAPGAVSGR
ncbi:dicarboxylate/amino acid:cation symporter [Methylobacillus gramineus]|uniref:dicarboxylate/amino acid:cation symporter n=1 Tax=Methylobacillus gramineus TaxID=755169 RepID=UPI001CFFBD98|nr:dicarboxylate/amino acid:cation symporter [Methylobacillus gramineus]MCB5185590.1 dicarboxylate/amino acid:cation symporter [Methylobacillus gramineus]